MSKSKRKYKIQNKRDPLVIFIKKEYVQDIFIIKDSSIQLVGIRKGDHSHGFLGRVWNEYHRLDEDMRKPTIEEINSVIEWLPKREWIAK